MEIPDDRWIRFVPQLYVAMTKQGLAKTTALQEVQILLAQDPIPTQALEGLLHRFGKNIIRHLEIIRLSHVLQIVPGRSLYELCEIKRLIDLSQFIVEKMSFAVVQNSPQFRLQPKPVLIGFFLPSCQKSQKCLSFLDSLGWRTLSP